MGTLVHLNAYKEPRKMTEKRNLKQIATLCESNHELNGYWKKLLIAAMKLHLQYIDSLIKAVKNEPIEDFEKCAEVHYNENFFNSAGFLAKKLSVIYNMSIDSFEILFEEDELYAFLRSKQSE